MSNPEVLSDWGRSAIQEAAESEGLYVSSISVWEVALLVKRGRLELSMEVGPWMRHCEALPELHFVPVDNRIALESVQLPDFGSQDPADRIIVATALELGANLVTRDERILDYLKSIAIW